jgi:ribonuclease HI
MDFCRIFAGNKRKGGCMSEIIRCSLSVDASCLGNPGVMEYRGVYTATGEEVFRQGPFPEGTNNIGEFLALVHGLALLKKHGSPMPVYSDSVTARAWVRKKLCKTQLQRSESNRALFELVERAEFWLRQNAYSTPVLIWDTPRWGEIPADFGRK